MTRFPLAERYDPDAWRDFLAFIWTIGLSRSRSGETEKRCGGYR